MFALFGGAGFVMLNVATLFAVPVCGTSVAVAVVWPLKETPPFSVSVTVPDGGSLLTPVTVTVTVVLELAAVDAGRFTVVVVCGVLPLTENVAPDEPVDVWKSIAGTGT